MGTRNLTAVMVDGEYKIAQYGQWDGYPSGQGVTALRFLLETDLDKFKQTMRAASFISDDEWHEIIENHTDEGRVIYGSAHEKYWKENLSHLDRDIGAGVLKVAGDGVVSKFKNELAFAGNSLFCEYAYVIDLDAEIFEIYEGFNKEPITDGRFVSGDPALEKEEGYEPIRLIKSYRLNDLPSEEAFLADLEPNEED